MKLFTSESVSEGHPDKVADRISDAVLDAFLAQDPQSHVAVETLVTTGQVVLAGEVHSNAYVDVQKVARDTIREIGYNKSEYQFDADSCGVLSAIHEQSSDIRMGVEQSEELDQGAGDQGMMFGYATNETKTYMPLPIYLANRFMEVITDVRKEGRYLPYLRPDAKSQVTIMYDGAKPIGIDTIVLSVQHDEFASDVVMWHTIHDDVQKYIIPMVAETCDRDIAEMLRGKFRLLVNPTGKFVIGGPHGDTGLTGRKIIVDTYGGEGAHGGGAFSGKDPSKVDRSAAYAARYVAKNMVAAGLADEILIQLSYAIGVAKPVSVCVDTKGTAKTKLNDDELADYISKTFDLRPKAIENKFKLRTPIYEPTASLGHFGRTSYSVLRKVQGKEMKVKLFPWEELDAVDMIKTDLL